MLKLPFFTDLLSSQLFYIVENSYSGKNVGLGMKKKMDSNSVSYIAGCMTLEKFLTLYAYFAELLF